MTVGVVTVAALLGYALGLGVFGARVVAGRAWAGRAPRTALLVWAGLVVALTAAITLTGAALALSTVPISTDLAAVLRTCVLALRGRYATPGGAALAGLGIVLVAGWLARLVYSLGRAVIAAAGERRRHTRLLTLVGRPDARLDATVVDHAAPAVYCVAGRPPTVVLTSTARETLSAEQLAAALAHERAHLRGRHHLILTVADGLAAAFPRVPLLAAARPEIGYLVELIADDAAARRVGRLPVAAALVRVAGPHAPAAALAAGATAAAARVRRLLNPPATLGRGAGLVVALAALALLAGPLALTVAPTLLAGHPLLCPFGAPHGIAACALRPR